MALEPISKENLTLTSVADIFKSAFINVVADGEDYYLQDTYKVWFSIDDQQNRFVKFETGILKNERASEAAILQAVNQMNLEYIMINVFYNGKAIRFQYYLWVEGGVLPADIVLTYRFFTRVLNNIIEELSEKNVLS